MVDIQATVRGTAARSLLRRGRRAISVRREVRRLRATGTPDALLLADLVRRATRWRPTPDEREWMRRIEAGRKRLAESTDVVHRQEDTPLTVAEVSKASQPRRGGRFLYAAVRAFGPTRCLELGTCLGVSAAYQAAALAADGRGRLVTVEGYPELAAQAERFLKDLHLDNVEVVVGRFGQVVPSIVAANPVDYAYIDGNHHEAPTVEYVSLIAAHCTTRTLIVLDDIRWSGGMRRAWDRVVATPGVTAHADLGRLGLLLLRPTG